jgi:hypothetical protein
MNTTLRGGPLIVRILELLLALTLQVSCEALILNSARVLTSPASFESVVIRSPGTLTDDGLPRTTIHQGLYLYSVHSTGKLTI